MDKTKTAIGIDLGGTFIKAGVVSGEGKLLSRDKLPTESKAGRDAVVDRMAQAAESVREKAGLTWDQISRCHLPHGQGLRRWRQLCPTRCASAPDLSQLCESFRSLGESLVELAGEAMEGEER